MEVHKRLTSNQLWERFVHNAGVVAPSTSAAQRQRSFALFRDPKRQITLHQRPEQFGRSQLHQHRKVPLILSRPKSKSKDALP
jgi:hypothetical protein